MNYLQNMSNKMIAVKNLKMNKNRKFESKTEKWNIVKMSRGWGLFIYNPTIDRYEYYSGQYETKEKCLNQIKLYEGRKCQ